MKLQPPGSGILVVESVLRARTLLGKQVALMLTRPALDSVKMGEGDVPFASQISFSMLLSGRSNLSNDCGSTGKETSLI